MKTNTERLCHQFERLCKLIELKAPKEIIDNEIKLGRELIKLIKQQNN